MYLNWFTKAAKLALIAVLLFGFVSEANGMNDDCLKLSISSSITGMMVGEEYKFHYRIQNQCRKDVRVNKEILPGGNLFLSVTDSKGNVTQEPTVDYMVASWHHADKMGKLGPDEEITKDETFFLNGLSYRDGTYAITASITMYPFAEDMKTKLPEIKLQSNTLTLKLSYRNLFAPVAANDFKRVQEMIRGGADAKIYDPHLGSLLHHVVDPKMARLLIEAGTPLETINGAGITPLQSKVWSVEIIRELIRSGANVNQPSKFGETALHFAATRGNLPVIDELIKHGAQVNAKDNTGGTPLQRATDPKVIEALKKYGAK